MLWSIPLFLKQRIAIPPLGNGVNTLACPFRTGSRSAELVAQAKPVEGLDAIGGGGVPASQSAFNS